jgi:hypothetical protein
MIGKREGYLGGKEPAGGGGGGAAGSGAVSPDDGEHVPQADPHRQVTLLHSRHQASRVHQHSAPQPNKIRTKTKKITVFFNLLQKEVDNIGVPA